MPSVYKIVIVVEQTEQQEDEWGNPCDWDFDQWTPASTGGCTDISYDVYTHEWVRRGQMLTCVICEEEKSEQDMSLESDDSVCIDCDDGDCLVWYHVEEVNNAN